MAKLDFVKTIHVPGLGNLHIKEGSGSFKPAAVQREAHEAEEPADSGYTEKNVKAEVKATVLSDPRLSVEDLNFRDKNVTVMLESGKEYMIPAAYATEPVELSKGEMPLTIASSISERIG